MNLVDGDEVGCYRTLDNTPAVCMCVVNTNRKT